MERGREKGEWNDDDDTTTCIAQLSSSSLLLVFLLSGMFPETIDERRGYTPVKRIGSATPDSMEMGG